MKILVVYATAGAGHRKAAEAVYNEAEKRNLNAVIADVLDFTHPWVKYLYSEGYLFLVKHLPVFWRVIFWVSDNLGYLFRRPSLWINTKVYVDYLKYLEKEKFDMVISAHFMASELTGCVKEKLGIRLINVVTDFCMHSIWFTESADKYCVPSDEAKKRLVSLGAVPEKIILTGIPISENFIQDYDRRQTAERLGLKPDIFTLLVMTGEIGIGPIAEIIDKLKDESQLIVVCGRNKKLFDDLSMIPLTNLKILGLVSNVYELMSVSDLIITKPGGLTTSEALAKGLAIIFFSIIPGQESGNAKIMEGHGAGIIAKNTADIKETVIKLKNSPELLMRYKQNAKRLSHPDSAARILDISISA